MGPHRDAAWVVGGQFPLHAFWPTLQLMIFLYAIADRFNSNSILKRNLRVKPLCAKYLGVVTVVGLLYEGGAKKSPHGIYPMSHNPINVGNTERVGKAVAILCIACPGGSIYALLHAVD